MRPAVFLDRDGTINVEKNYLHRVADWEWIPGAPEAIARLNRVGYLVVVVTNQAGVARGLYTERDIHVLHDHVSAELAEHGARVDAYYHCPHHPDFDLACACRKPAPGMILRAIADLDIDRSRSWMVGDKAVDAQAGEAAWLGTVLVRTGYGADEEHDRPRKTLVVDTVAHAVEIIVSETAPLPVGHT